MSFVVGIPHLHERVLLVEALQSIRSSSLWPKRLIIVDNSGAMPDIGYKEDVTVIWPEKNLGVAASWNLLHKLAAPLPLILMNDDTAVARDTFERMMAEPGPAVVCAWGYNCVRIDHEVWQGVGDFDEKFFPAYYEDADHRRRCKIAGVRYVDWDPEPSEEVSPGRRRSAQGIVHGKPAVPGQYQCWNGPEFDKFHELLEANKQYYIRKWGGQVGEELYRRPFGS